MRNQKASRMETRGDKSGAKSGSRKRLKLRERTRCEESLRKDGVEEHDAKSRNCWKVGE